MKVTSGSDLKPESYQINAKICRLVEKFPCMYDRSHPQYLKKDVVDKAWVKISKEMDDSIPSCKERWRNIRTSFARSINVNKVPASANRTKPYYLHEELQFLARHITPGIPIPRRSNAYSSAGEESEVIEVSVGEDTFDGFVLAHACDADDERQDGEGDEDDDESSQAEHPASSIDEQQEAAAAIVAAIKREPSDTPLCVPKKRRRTVDLTPDNVAVAAAAASNNVVEQKFSEQQPTTSTPDADFDSIFLQGLLPEMKAMDFRQKILFKRRIYEVMSEVFEHPSSSSSMASAAAGQPQVQNPNHTHPPCITPTTPNVLHAKVSTTPSPNVAAPATPTYTPPMAPTMTVVNAADLAMIRRLNSLLQSPQNAVNATLTTMAAAPKNLAAASAASTVRTAAAPATATVAVNRGALTRASANLLRVTMVNPPAAATTVVPTTPPAATPTAPVIKQEPEVVDD